MDTTTALGVLEVCDNGIDDDGDGLTDCADPACSAHLACTGCDGQPDCIPQYKELLCANGVDDDGDGKIDCEDPDCAGTLLCDPNASEICNNAVDDDGDGLIDCRDPDCAQAGNCQEHCSDTVDNDGDGLTDCDDPDCAMDPACLMERCANGQDDDGDGKIDCDDPDCVDAPNCATVPPLEICNDGLDNDGDGKIDCIDPDCQTNPLCIEVYCFDGWDNDANGLVDCEDPACQSTPACQLSTSCAHATPLSCGASFSGTTRGRVSSFGTYACYDGDPLLGGERVFTYTNLSPTMASITVFLEPRDPNTTFKLFLLSGDSLGCAGTSACLTATNQTDLSATLYLAHNQTVYLVVDSLEAHGGEFEIFVSCQSTYYESCTNHVDDDNDGAIDCWDSDCWGDPACDYWVSAGEACEINSPEPCPNGEFCHSLMVNGTLTTRGICTRDCFHPGMPGTDCYNPNFTLGECPVNTDGQSTCILRCGTQYMGNAACPEGTVCTNLASGSTANVTAGYCAPGP